MTLPVIKVVQQLFSYFQLLTAVWAKIYCSDLLCCTQNKFFRGKSVMFPRTTLRKVHPLSFYWPFQILLYSQAEFKTLEFELHVRRIFSFSVKFYFILIKLDSCYQLKSHSLRGKLFLNLIAHILRTSTFISTFSLVTAF